MKNLKENDIVYFLQHWTYGNVIQGKVTRILKDDIVKIHCLHSVDRNGEITSDEYGEQMVNISKVFPSPVDAYALSDKIKDNCIKGYCQNIKTIEDLIHFPLKHCLNGEEYTDNNAVEAYKIRAKELLDIKL